MFLKSFIGFVKQFAKKANTAAEKPFRKEADKVLQELQKRSPVDSGQYRASWKVREGAKTAGIIRSFIFYNTDAKFPLMEYGAEPEEAPWYFPGKKKKKTGKLTVAKGRVWAGGLNPGHSLTIGGAITPVLDRYRKTSAGEEISEVVLRRI
jgi:hypothetical protein